jgi:hypothetical protein
VNLLIGALLAVGGVLAVIIAVQGTQGQFYQVITGQTAGTPASLSSGSTSTTTPIGTITPVSPSAGNPNPGVTGPAGNLSKPGGILTPLFGSGGGRVTSPLT